MTVRQYGYAFQASSCISNEPFGANRRINAGTFDAKWYILYVYCPELYLPLRSG